MKRDILGKAVKLNIDRRRRKRWQKVVSGLAALVVFATTYALILPAITMESETLCGLAEHTHTDACWYTPIVDTGAVLNCPVELHVHTTDCCDETGAVVCGFGEQVIHTHDAICYDEAGTLVCVLPEVREHRHEDGCFEERTVYTCGMEEGENAHVHDDACYGPGELLCGLEESEEHTHDESCFDDAPLICGLSESPGHVHDENCGGTVVRTLVCGREAVTAHTHGEDCFDASGALVCGMVQVEVHQHDESCFTYHVHDESCFRSDAGETAVVCGFHIHGEECLNEAGERICGQPVLICALAEHTHDENCYTPDGEEALPEEETVVLLLHDVDPYGAEYEGSPLSLQVPLGSTLAEQDAVLVSDGAAVAACLWYAADGQIWDTAAPLEAGTELYTYSYALRLDMSTLASQPAVMLLSLEEETQTSEENVVSIVKRSGDTLTESDLIVDEEDYGDYLWVDDAGSEVDLDDLVGTTLSENYAVTLAAETDYTIYYNININQTVFGTKPSVGGASTLTDTYNSGDGDYTIRVPNPTNYMVTNGKYRTLYQFTGWKIARNNNVVAAGATVDASWVKSNVNRNSTRVTLTAQWNAVSVTETVHFFVNLNCQVTDTEGSTSVPTTGEFTNSVFSTSTTVTGSSMRNYWQGPKNDSQYIVFQAEHENDTANVDAEIRRLINGHDSTNDTYNGSSVWKNGYTGTKLFQVADFPSDEQVLAVVRDMVASGTVIRMNGVALTADELTTDNFTVRWNVFKYDSGDGWHIDGILVAKQAYLTVKKVFLGDDAAVQAVKDGGFTITLRNTSNTSVQDMTLTLTPGTEETGSGCIGYTAFDAASNTYTWNVPLEQNSLYSVIENKYLSADDAVQTSASYTINNSPEAFVGWQTYPEDGIEDVQAYAYPNDVDVAAYQTVVLRNSYVKADTLTIHKIDMDTGNGMAGISYRLTDAAGSELTLYKKPDASYYSMKAEDEENGFVLCSDNIITTDSNGAIFLKLDSGTFTLEEAFPTGYGGYSKITVTVGVDTNGSVVFDEISSSDSTIEVDGTLIDKNTATLTVRNVSYPTSITARKVWVDESDAQDVTVALYRNGAALGSEYQTVLTSDNDWSHTWEDLPLYADGERAVYSLREIKIGSTLYDPSADTDGYAGYIVVYDEMVYSKNSETVSGPAWTDENGVTQYADNALLTVRNEVYRGQLVFRKVDENGKALPGAVFRLYRDTAQTQLLAESVSDEYGRVIFENLMPGTYYVMKETETPAGYVGADVQYKVRLSARGTTTLEEADTGQTLSAVVNYTDEIELRLRKINEAEVALSGAVFRLEQKDGDEWSLLGRYETDGSGLVRFGELPAGSYRLVEEEAPAGYIPLDGSIEFTVQNLALTLAEEPGSWGVYQDNETGVYMLTVINKTGYELPETGGPTALGYTYGGLLLILAAAMSLGYQRRRGRKEDSS